MKLTPYPKYKDSGIEWLGKIPEGWEVKRLKYISLVRPSNVDKKTEGGETEIRLCNYIDVYNNESIDDSIDFMIASATFDEIKKFRILRGDVLITKDSEEWDDIAVPSFVKGTLETVICGYHLALVRPKSGMIDGKYLFRTFQSYIVNSQFRLSANGITRYGLSKNSISSAVFLVPSLPKQQAIADFLDHKTSKIDELIKKNEKLIELLKEKRQAIISHAVTKGIPPHPPLEKGGWGALKMKDSGIEWIGEIPERWEVKRLKYVAEIVLGKMLQNEDTGNDKLKFYMRAQNIQWEVVDTNDVKEMWFSDYEIKKYRLQKGDLLVSEGGEVGRTALWNGELEECYIQNSVHKVTVDKKLANNRYLLYLLEKYGKWGYFESIVNRVSIGHLTREKLKEIEIICPPKNEQEQIVTYLDKKSSAIDKTIQKILSQIEKLKEYRQALISNVVTGKVKINEDQ